MDGKSQTIKEWSEMMFGGSTEQFDGQPSDTITMLVIVSGVVGWSMIVESAAIATPVVGEPAVKLKHTA